MQEQYEVLKFAEHGGNCHIGQECVKGSLLIEWVKYHPIVPKEQMLQMIREIFWQIEQFERGREKQYYKAVNPYGIVVGEDGHVYLLDLKAKSNEGIIRKMKRHSIQSCFYPPPFWEYQEDEGKRVIYQAGKLFQFLLAELEVCPKIRKWEEWRLRNFIRRCLLDSRKKPYQNTKEMLMAYVRIQTKVLGSKSSLRRRISFFICLLILGITVKIPIIQEPERTKSEQKKKKIEVYYETEEKSIAYYLNAMRENAAYRDRQGWEEVKKLGEECLTLSRQQEETDAAQMTEVYQLLERAYIETGDWEGVKLWEIEKREE